MTPPYVWQHIPDICTECLNKKRNPSSPVMGMSKDLEILERRYQLSVRGLLYQHPSWMLDRFTGIYPMNFTQTQKQTKLLDFGLLQARRMTALYWRSMEAPTL